MQMSPATISVKASIGERTKERKEQKIPHKQRMWKVGTNQWHGKYSFYLSDTYSTVSARAEEARKGPRGAETERSWPNWPRTETAGFTVRQRAVNQHPVGLGSSLGETQCFRFCVFLFFAWYEYTLDFASKTPHARWELGNALFNVASVFHAQLNASTCWTCKTRSAVEYQKKKKRRIMLIKYTNEFKVIAIISLNKKPFQSENHRLNGFLPGSFQNADKAQIVQTHFYQWRRFQTIGIQSLTDWHLLSIQSVKHFNKNFFTEFHSS